MPTTKKTEVQEAAQEREAEAVGLVTVEYAGVEFTIPQDIQDWPAEALLMLEDDKPISFVRQLVDEKAFSQILKNRLTVRQYGELADKIAQAAGLETGN